MTFICLSSYANAAVAGINKAIDAGSKSPVLVCVPPWVTQFKVTKFPQVTMVTLLAALEAIYVPIETREQVPEKARKVISGN